MRQSDRDAPEPPASPAARSGSRSAAPENQSTDFFQALPLPALAIDQETGAVLEANDRFLAWLGLSRAVWPAACPLRDIQADPADVERCRTLVAATPGPCEAWASFGGPGGLRRRGALSLTAVTTSGRPALLAVVRDEGGVAWRECEGRIRNLLLERLPALAVQGYGPDGRVRYWNEASERLYGYTAAEAAGRSLLDLIIPPPMREEVRRAIEAMRLSGEPIPAAELRLMRKDGSLAPVFSSHVVVDLPDGPELYCLDIDLTEQKRAEERQRQAERRRDAVLDSLDDVVIKYLDHDMRILWVNATLCRSVGVTAEALAGRKCYEAIHQRAAPCPGCPAPAVIGSGQPAESEFTTPAGRTFLAHNKPILDEQGRVTGLTQICVDITDRKRMESQLAEAKEAAERANQAKSQFLANMSHEIRTPLNGVLGMIEASLQADDPAQARRYLRLAKQSGRALLALLSDFLDLSRIEAGKLELRSKPFSPRELVAQTVETLAAAAAAKGLSLTATVAEGTPQACAGDGERVRQVLTNLVDNAVKYTERGLVAITVTFGETGGDGAAPSAGTGLRFSVRDTGVGIAEDKLEAVFGAFIQGAEQGQPLTGGVGLGLAISRSLTHMMGGSLRASSRPGEGSLFVLELPLRAAAPEPGAERPPGPAWNGRSLSILLVEDNPINRILAAALLQKRGHVTTCVENGRQALEALRRGGFDLVLMDARMPVMDGFEATRRIRAGEAGNPDVPIVALTAHALVGDRERFLAVGMNEYVAKPFDPEELDVVFARLLRGEAASPRDPGRS